MLNWGTSPRGRVVKSIKLNGGLLLGGEWLAEEKA
jgi:hypothetical protein